MIRLAPFALIVGCGMAAAPETLARASDEATRDLTDEATATPDPGAATSLDALQLVGLDGQPLDAATLRGKAVLFVNVASRCGFTPQYEGLQALYEAHVERGLVIVGVPCNQFGGQEPGTAQEIASFCRMNYGVTFPLLEKQDVNGPRRSPLYRFLVGSDVGAGKPIKWNFEKFLVAPSGEVVARWPSSVDAADSGLLAALDSVLPKAP